MAQHTVQGTGILDLWVDKRHLGSAAKPNDELTTPANFVANADLDTRLAAISGTTYTAARLQVMTQNDKHYALRRSDEAGSLP
jgi:hypothetical protein